MGLYVLYVLGNTALLMMGALVSEFVSLVPFILEALVASVFVCLIVAFVYVAILDIQGAFE